MLVVLVLSVHVDVDRSAVVIVVVVVIVDHHHAWSRLDLHIHVPRRRHHDVEGRRARADDDVHAGAIADEHHVGVRRVRHDDGELHRVDLRRDLADAVQAARARGEHDELGALSHEAELDLAVADGTGFRSASRT